VSERFVYDPEVVEGALLFGRFAYPPNRLGYCGPAESRSVYAYVAERRVDEGFFRLARDFQAAYFYLSLIAYSNGYRNPFHRKVVEAYWIGNELLDHVTPRKFYDALAEKFKKRMPDRAFAWLVGKLEHGAHPHHNFHVFDVYTRTGALKSARPDIALEHMDKCRGSWGSVEAVFGGQVAVRRQPLVLQGDRLQLGDPEVVLVDLAEGDVSGVLLEVKPGDTVAVHWDWAAHVLTPKQLRRLKAETELTVRLANEALALA